MVSVGQTDVPSDSPTDHDEPGGRRMGRRGVRGEGTSRRGDPGPPPSYVDTEGSVETYGTYTSNPTSLTPCLLVTKPLPGPHRRATPPPEVGDRGGKRVRSKRESGVRSGFTQLTCDII